MNGDFELRHWRRRPRPQTLAIPSIHLFDPSASLSPSSNGEFTAYTSLCDLISPAANSAASPSAASDICIKNRLLKHAAYAYLQATPSMDSPSYRRHRRRRRLSIRRAIGSCFGFIAHLFRKLTGSESQPVVNRADTIKR